MNRGVKRMPSRLTQTLIALLIGLSAALFGLSGPGKSAEENLGLDLLFWLRGTQEPPAEVVIVSIDRESADKLGASDEPEHWPRSLHAALIQRLQEAGAGMIVFNVFFGVPQPFEDQVMASVMREAGNVVLTDYLKRRHYSGGIYVESIVEPVPILSEAALATAPFLLPQTAKARGFLSRYGERYTLPATLLHLYVLHNHFDDLIDFFRTIDHPVADFLEGHLPELSQANGTDWFRNAWARRSKARPQIVPIAIDRLDDTDIPAEIRGAAAILIGTSEPGKLNYFNHYGPAGTVRHRSYHEIVDASSDADIAVRGKVVLVGFSRDFQPESTEGLFYSPFSPVSAVELAATAFANTLKGETIRPRFGPLGHFLWLLVWGFLLGLCGQTGRLWLSITGIMAVSLAYLAIATYSFGTHGTWLPVTLPLLWEAPAAFSLALWRSYLQRTRERQSIESVFKRFIPVHVVSQLIRETERGDLDNFGHVTFGVCLASDAGQYTTLAETMEPMRLTNMMNAYYGELFPAVTGNHGWVSDVVGDAMMAIWTGTNNIDEIKVRALQAAIGMYRAAAAFERSWAVKLPLRIGIHCGEMRVGLVGSADHNEFRATGDTVNTAARLEALNKLLGTQIIASATLLDGIRGFTTRPLGSFVLAGKSRPVEVSELVAGKALSDDLLGPFQAALSVFQAGAFDEAQTLFARLAKEFPADGPTRFYLDAATRNAATPSAHSKAASIRTEKPAPGDVLSK